MRRIVVLILLITFLTVPAFSQDDGCLIKGNINSKGQKLYHLPGWPSYNSTKIDTDAGERWFCTEEEAIAAGWSPAVTTTPKPTSTPKPTKTPKPTPTPRPTATPKPYEVIGEHVYTLKDHYGELTTNQMYYLSNFSAGRPLDFNYYDEYKFPIGQTSEVFSQWLLDNGYLRNPTKAEIIERVYGQKYNIEAEMRARGLKISGTKAELIERLIEAYPDITDQYTWQTSIYYPTDKAKVLLNEYVDDLDKALENAVMDTLDHLAAGDLDGAYEIVLTYRTGSAQSYYGLYDREAADFVIPKENLKKIYTEDNYWSVFYGDYVSYSVDIMSRSRHSIALAFLFSRDLEWLVKRVDFQKYNDLMVAR